MFLQRMFKSVKLWFSFMRVSYQIAYGFFHILQLPRPIVTIFGASRASQEDDYAELAHALSDMFANAGISVVTGGGPGIMEAASCGAIKNEENVTSVGIGVRDLGEGKNECVSDYFQLDYFFARKWLLTRYSAAFIVFPGGYGTLDELAEVLTLIQTKKLPLSPIVLIGTEYWHPFLQWLKRETLGHGFIEEKHLDLFILTDDLQEAFTIVQDVCEVAEAQQEQKEKE